MFQRARTGADPRQLRHHLHPQPYALRVTSSTYRAKQLSQTLGDHTFRHPCDSTLLRRATTSWDGFETIAFRTMYAGLLFSKPTARDVISREKGLICFDTVMINLKQRSFDFQALDYWAQVVKRKIVTHEACHLMTHTDVSYIVPNFTR